MLSLSWTQGDEEPLFEPVGLISAGQRVRESAFVVHETRTRRTGLAFGGTSGGADERFTLLAQLPPLYPEWLGDRSFLEAHGLRFPYVAGAMANGLTTEILVEEMARGGCLGFFGAAGLDPERVERAMVQLANNLNPEQLPWGSNLIHSPNQPELESAIVDLYLKHGVRRVSASAFMKLSLPAVRYAVTGLEEDSQGRIQRRNHLFAKVSRTEVAEPFMNPAPAAMLQSLRDQGQITAEEQRLAQLVAVADDIIVESDSGGHTDNRPLTALFPTMMELRDRVQRTHQLQRPLRLGAAGGLGTPAAVAAAFSLGASFVLTGSVNQGCVESGLDPSGRQLLAGAGLADVMMAPAADMFEMGVEVQVLKKGSLFGVRAKKLYEFYRSYPSLEAIPQKERTELETKILLCSIDEAWQMTRQFWLQRDPKEIDRAESNEKHKMALVFRSYLGQSSKWAISGTKDRALDYQIWCGPAMGAFNEWVRGSFLEDPEQRNVIQVARNLLEGAAVVTRTQQFRSAGAPMPANAFHFEPRPLL